MTAFSNPDMQQLKEFIGDRFNEFDRKVDNKFNELKLEITELKAEFKQETAELKQETAEIKTEIKGIDKRLSNVETAIQKIPDLAEKVGEFKNWKQSGTIGSFIGWIAIGFKA
jgi:chromosome segregation ATPase